MAELQSSHEQLQHYVRIARSEQKRLASLNAISAVLTRCLELEQTLKKASSLVMDMLVFAREEEARELVLIAYEGASEEFAQEMSRIKVGESFYGRVAEAGEPIVVEDEAADSGTASPVVKQMKIQAQLIVPITVGEHIVGVLCAGNRRPRKLGEMEVDLLTAISSQIGVAIENARLYEREHSATQRALASERKYREVFENAHDAIWLHDLQGNIMAANEATEKLTGYSLEELLKMNVRSFLSHESLELAGRVRRRLFVGEPVEQPYEQRLIRRDGTEAILMLGTNLITEDGKSTGFQHIASPNFRSLKGKRIFWEFFQIGSAIGRGDV